MALRTDAKVIDFIDCEAVKKAYSNNTLTLDQVLLEIEKDERYDQSQGKLGKNEINHKEFVTWREFLNYFNDYQEIEARNRKQTHVATAQKAVKKDDGAHDPEAEAENEMMTLMEQEKERRLQELPKLRPADQIDITEKQLQLIKDIFDSCPRASSGKDAVSVGTFFITIRKDPQIRAINTTIARDPEGFSRVPRETFQEVFDRMERELQQKTVEWAAIVEFFTKRGRPLSKDEIQKLVDEDRKAREVEEARKRAEEEAERRMHQRIQNELAEEEEFEAPPTRSKAGPGQASGGKGRDFDGSDRLRATRPDAITGSDEEDGSDDEDLERAVGNHGVIDRDVDSDEVGDPDGDYDFDREKLSRTKLTQKDY